MLDIVELYIPIISLIIIFFVFILQIFYRYILKTPLIWTQEVILINFVWATLLGACYARRCAQHIQFDIVINSISTKKRILFNIIGNILVIIVFIYLFYPTIKYIQFMYTESSPFLRIPFNVIDFPFIIFLFLFIGYSVNDVVTNCKRLLKGRKR